MEQNNFFDCHCHTMTLAQPNMTSFIENIMRNIGPDMIKSMASENNFNHSLNPKQGVSNILNLAALVQNDLEGIFCIMEDDLKGVYGGKALANEEGLTLGGKRYERLIITPLLMDFKSLPGAPCSTYYPQPMKEMHTTINEYAYGIRQYYKSRPKGLLQIFPFLGLNTAAYTYKEVVKILQDSFEFYTGNLNSIRSSKVYSYIAGKVAPSRMFGGIKVYPPMGFDPWPDDKEELKKVHFLYEYAQEKQIPITSHCNGGGYLTIDYDQAMENTSPERWAKVLKAYPTLRLNLAHMGYRGETLPQTLARKLGGKRERTWTDAIFDLIVEYPHVYTDISSNGVNPTFYKTLIRLLGEQGERRDIIEQRIIFGTDFMINLTSIPSYQEYYRIFEESLLTPVQLNQYGSVNPKRFLNM